MQKDQAQMRERAGTQPAASATECTGLVAALPPDDDALRDCVDLCAVLRSKSPRRMFRKK